jgi:multidrug efflux pump subunit AcrB
VNVSGLFIRRPLTTGLVMLGMLVFGIIAHRALPVAARRNGTRRIVRAIQRQPGTNTIEVVNAVRKLVPAFREQVPPGISIAVPYDRSKSMRASVEEVQFSRVLALGLALVGGLVFTRILTLCTTPVIYGYVARAAGPRDAAAYGGSPSCPRRASAGELPGGRGRETGSSRACRRRRPRGLPRSGS